MRAITSRGVVSLFVLAVLAVPMTAGCGSEEPAAVSEAGGAAANEAAAEASSGDLAALVEGGNEFAFDLYGRLAGDGNLFFSPYSISTALTMTVAGARGNTELEMAAALHFPTEDVAGKSSFISRERVGASCAALQEGLVASRETRGYELHVANSLWGQYDYPFKMSFLDLVERHFGGGFNTADFVSNAEAERVRINAWVESETREKIEDLIPSGGVDGATVLVLTNAVYFKGQWLSRFDEERTADATFHGAHGDATVPMMNQKGDFRYFENDVVQALEMPYEGGNVSMLVFLPRIDGPRGLEALEASLTPEMLSDWSGRLREQKLKVFFPRFEMTWGTEEISEHLMALGIRDAFFEGRADFTGMSDRNDLFIDKVFHKAFVAVNEEGTEAAAATAVVMARVSIERETIFRADHPFLFVIRDNATGSILFMGRVADLG